MLLASKVPPFPYGATTRYENLSAFTRPAWHQHTGRIFGCFFAHQKKNKVGCLLYVNSCSLDICFIIHKHNAAFARYAHFKISKQ